MNRSHSLLSHSYAVARQMVENGYASILVWLTDQSIGFLFPSTVSQTESDTVMKFRSTASNVSTILSCRRSGKTGGEERKKATATGLKRRYTGRQIGASGCGRAPVLWFPVVLVGVVLRTRGLVFGALRIPL